MLLTCFSKGLYDHCLSLLSIYSKVNHLKVCIGSIVSVLKNVMAQVVMLKLWNSHDNEEGFVPATAVEIIVKGCTAIIQEKSSIDSCYLVNILQIPKELKEDTTDCNIVGFVGARVVTGNYYEVFTKEAKEAYYLIV